MIEQMRRAAVLLVGLALLAPLAWGQATGPTLTQKVDDSLVIASEYFGSESGREVAVMGRAPKVILDVGSDSGIDEGNTATVTFTLTGATFGAAVGGGNLRVQRYVAVTGATTSTYNGDLTFNNNARAERVAGGAAGASSVSFMLTVGSDELIGRTSAMTALGSDATTAENFPDDKTGYLGMVGAMDSGETGASLREADFITFNLPNLTVTPAPFGAMQERSGVMVTASIEQGTTTGDPFPSVINGSGTGVMGQPGYMADGLNPMVDGLVLETMPAIMATLADGTDATASLMDRSMLSATGGANPLRATGVQPTADAQQSLLVGTLSLAFAADPQQLSNNAAAADTSEDPPTSLASNAGLAGNVVISVAGTSGAFRTGDKVYYGPNGSTREFTMGANGVATYSVSLSDALSGQMIRYVPNGTDPLRPATLTATLALNFTDPDNASGAVPMQKADAAISYGGIALKAYAYGVVSESGAGRSSVRVTCAGGVTPPATGCTVFWDCTDQEGASYFSNPTTVGLNQTVPFQSATIAEAFPGGGWERGRGSCDLWSDGDLEVQHMNRTGSIQVNNSVVIGASGDTVGTLMKGAAPAEGNGG